MKSPETAHPPAKKLIAATIIGIAALLISGWATTTQNFAPNRFALLAAEVDAESPQYGPGSHGRKVLAKLDTQTGEVQLLQLRIAGAEDPRIQAASWRTVPGNERTE